MKNVKTKTNEQIAMQVSANSIAVNLMLSIFKLIAGLLASSGAMISDATQHLTCSAQLLLLSELRFPVRHRMKIIHMGMTDLNVLLLLYWLFFWV